MFNLTDIVRFTIEGNLEMLMASIFSQKRRELVHIRGFYDNKHLKAKLEKVFTQKYCRHLWNPLLFAVEIGHLHIVRFFIEFIKGNVALLLQGPTNDDNMLDIEHNFNFEHLRCFALILSIQAGHMAMFKYLLNHLHYLWCIPDLKQVAKIIASRGSSDPLRRQFFEIFVSSRPFYNVFKQYFLNEQVEFLAFLINGDVFDIDDFEDLTVIQILEGALLSDASSASAMACIGIYNSVHRSNIETSVDKILEALSKVDPLVLAMNKEYVRDLIDDFAEDAVNENELLVI